MKMTDVLKDYLISGSNEDLGSAAINCQPLVVQASNILVGSVPSLAYLKDEFRSDGNLALMTLIPRVRKRLVAQPKLDVYFFMINELIESMKMVVREFQNFSMCMSTYRNRRNEGVLIPSSSAVIDPQVLAEMVVEPDREADLMELIYDSCHCETERTIIDMKVRGLTTKEIATETGMSTGSVSKTLACIRQRVTDEMYA